MSPQTDVLWRTAITIVTALAVFVFVRHGWPSLLALLKRQERWYERVLNQQLLIDIDPRVAVGISIMTIIITGMIGYILMEDILWGIVGAAIGLVVPNLVVRHLEQRRAARLNEQIVDGIVSLASGVRAGLTLVQSMELLVRNSTGPIRQEFAQLLREYSMGMDLNQAMRNAANRIQLSSYRLLFTAIEMHRLRGGDTGESLDRIAESIREIQRLEGKLDAMTAQPRMQANMMAALPPIIIAILAWIAPDEVGMLFTEPIGRLLLLIVAAMILAGFFWIRRIMVVDI